MKRNASTIAQIFDTIMALQDSDGSVQQDHESFMDVVNNIGEIEQVRGDDQTVQVVFSDGTSLDIQVREY